MQYEKQPIKPKLEKQMGKFITTRRFLNKSIKRYIILILFLQLFCSSCQKEYEYNTAYIYKTQFVHIGRGFYKLKIYYSFEYHDSIFTNYCNTPGLYEITARKRFREEDSVFVKYPVGKPEKSELANYIVKRKKQITQ